MALRVAAGVEQQMPGITGWAQINGRDSISLEAKGGAGKILFRQPVAGLGPKNTVADPL